MENEDGVRIAHCSAENLTLKLPKKGIINFKDAIAQFVLFKC